MSRILADPGNNYTPVLNSHAGPAQQSCSGFKNLGQCVAAAHVSKNLGIGFACLKSDMTGTAAPAGRKQHHNRGQDHESWESYSDPEPGHQQQDRGQKRAVTGQSGLENLEQQFLIESGTHRSRSDAGLFSFAAKV
jgi:hypothetical protein